MNPLSTLGPGIAAALYALTLSPLIYLLMLYDARRKDSTAADDDQLGIKTVAATLIIISTAMFAVGFQQFLHTFLTFDEVWERLKQALPNVLVGGLGVVGTALVLFPKTNASEYPKAKRLAAGTIALLSGMAMLPALALFLRQLLEWPTWSDVAEAFSIAVDALVIFGVAFMALGRLSGMKMPEMKSKGPPDQGMAAPQMAAPGQPQQPMAQPQQPMAQPQQPYPGQPQQPYAAQPGQPQQPYPGQPQQPYPGQPGQPPGGQGWPQG